MKKKLFFRIIVLFAGIGTFHLAPTIAGESADSPTPIEKGTTSTDDLRGERNFNRNNEQIHALATEYNVSLKGKDSETILKELRQALMNGTAKELGLSTEGKSLEELLSEFESAYSDDEEANKKNKHDLRLQLGNRKEQLINKAREYGVQTDNKELETVQQEILERMVHSKARESGISTKGKDMNTLMDELREAFEEKGKEKTVGD